MGVGIVGIDSEVIHTFTAYVCAKGMSFVRTGSQLTPSILIVISVLFIYFFFNFLISAVGNSFIRLLTYKPFVDIMVMGT